MERDRVGVSPVSATTMLDCALGALARRSLTAGLPDARLIGLARALGPALPDHLLPDVYLEQPLVGPHPLRALVVLEAYERAYLNHHTKGAYFARTGIEARVEPASYDWCTGLVATEAGTRPFAARDDSLDARRLADEATCADLCARLGASQDGALGSALRMLASLPVRVWVGTCSQGTAELVVILPRDGVRRRFENAPYRQDLVGALVQLGVPAKVPSRLDQACVRLGVPCEADGRRWLVSVDVSHVSLRLKDGALVSCGAGLRISERTVAFAHTTVRPTRSYQWHITDRCDQRCSHCYLFAEGRTAVCRTMPYPQLMHTIDEVVLRNAQLNAMPAVNLTGGDPLLHPDFWELVTELGRQGFLVSVMGNPFHLDDGVCRRLRSLGCRRYQLSLDGLKAYHDGNRRPGSFDATLSAIPMLKRAGIAVQVMATASRQNLSDILALMDVADELDVDSFAFARYCATSPERAAERYPSPDEYRRFLVAYYERRQHFIASGSRCDFRLKEHLFCLLRYELGEFEPPRREPSGPDVILGGCHLGTRCAIAADGALVACPRMPSVVGSLVHDHLGAVEDGPLMRRYRQVGSIEGCAGCRLLSSCRGCRAVGYNLTGDLQTRDPMCWHQVR